MKVLIVRVGAMGDVLHALPGVAALRKAQPDWQIDWAVDERWRSLLASGDRGAVVDSVLSLPIRAWKRFPRSVELLRSVRQLYALRRDRYDLVVDMQGTLRSAVIGRLAGGRRLAGYTDPRETAARLLYARKLERKGTHVVQQGATLLSEACGLELAPALGELPLDGGAERWAAAFVAGLGAPERLAVLAPSAGWPAKQWPAANFAMLARELAQEGWTVLVNNPGANEPAAAEVLAGSDCSARTVNCGIAEFTALLRRVRLVIGGDSGPVHLAAALGVPLVALFGPTDPARNGPWGPGPMCVLRHRASVTSYRHVAQADPGLAKITVAQVLEAVRSLGKPATPVCENDD